MRTYFCTSHNKDVTIGDCVRCGLMCVYNPSGYEAMLQSGPMVERWGYAEIESFLESRRVLAATGQINVQEVGD